MRAHWAIWPKAPHAEYAESLVLGGSARVEARIILFRVLTPHHDAVTLE